MKSFSQKEFIDVVGMADPNSGKILETNCQNAIVVVGQNDEGCAFVLSEWAARCATDELTRQIFLYNRQWACHRFGVDSTGQQNLYFQQLIREANIRRERIALVPRQMPSTEKKEFRLTTTIQHWMHNGLLFINDDCPLLLKQLERFPTGQLVDLVDALAECLRMLRDPMAARQRLEYDPSYDETERWKKAIRNDGRYNGMSR